MTTPLPSLLEPTRELVFRLPKTLQKRDLPYYWAPDGLKLAKPS